MFSDREGEVGGYEQREKTRWKQQNYEQNCVKDQEVDVHKRWRETDQYKRLSKRLINVKRFLA